MPTLWRHSAAAACGHSKSKARLNQWATDSGNRLVRAAGGEITTKAGWRALASVCRHPQSVMPQATIEAELRLQPQPSLVRVGSHECEGNRRRMLLWT